MLAAGLLSIAMGDPSAWPAELAPLHVHNVNTNADGTLRLYAEGGGVDEAALALFAKIATTDEEEHPLAKRLVMLVAKAAYHFKAYDVLTISGYRPQTPWRGSRHATGEALDFQLAGVKAGPLAAYLRTLAHVGVGLYTHPLTQYVHLDVRDESYHWVDGSPPGITWRESPLRDYFWAKKQDDAYVADMDLPFDFARR